MIAFIINKSGVSKISGFVNEENGECVIVDHSGENVANRITKEKKEDWFAAFLTPGFNVDVYGRKYDCYGAFIMHKQGKKTACYYDDDIFYDDAVHGI